MPLPEDHLAAVFRACDEEGKGFLTAEDMERLLERVVGPGQQSREILAILGCGESSTTVTWQQFRQNIAQFLGDKENLAPGHHRESPGRQTVNGRRQGEVTEPGLSPFRPRLNSSPLPGRRLVMQLGRRGCSLEDTFEGDGEEQSLYSSHSVVNKSHRRKSTQDLPLRELDPLENLELDIDEKLQLHFENEALQRQVGQYEQVIARLEREISVDRITMQSLEEQLTTLELNNKELGYDLDSSKYNVKNLESHMFFLEEKITTESNELLLEKTSITLDRQQLQNQKIIFTEKQKKLDEELADILNQKDNFVSEKKTLKKHISHLEKELASLQRNSESLQLASKEKIDILHLENQALKDLVVRLQQNHQNLETPSFSTKRDSAGQTSLLTCIFEYLIQRICSFSVNEVMLYLWNEKYE